jgi:hypothetical protein
LGKAEGCSGPKEGSTRPEEILRSQAMESCHAQETVGDDEGKVGGEEKGGLEDGLG